MQLAARRDRGSGSSTLWLYTGLLALVFAADARAQSQPAEQPPEARPESVQKPNQDPDQEPDRELPQESAEKSAAAQASPEAAQESPQEPAREAAQESTRQSSKQSSQESSGESFQGPPEPQEADPPKSAEICAEDQPEPITVLERARMTLTTGACASAAWLDGLFGDQLYYDEYRDTYGSVSVGTLWREYEGLDPRVRFRVRLQLPQMDERLSAFIGRVGREEFVSDSEGSFVALPTRQFGGRLEEETLLVGLGYSQAERTGNDFDFDVGVRVRMPLDPYARGSYELVRTLADHYVFRGRQTVFWQNTEGFGTTTRLILDRALSERYLARWGALGKLTQETVGVEWYSEATLFQTFSERTALAWQAHIGGQSDNEVRLTDYGARIIMRRRLSPEWLYLELRAGMHWPRYFLHEQREASPEAGIALEMLFGRYRP